MSQADLASKINFSSPTAVALIESGERKVSIERLEKIAEVLGKNTSFFLDDEEKAADVKVALRAASGLSEKDRKLLERVYDLVKEDSASTK